MLVTHGWSIGRCFLWAVCLIVLSGCTTGIRVDRMVFDGPRFSYPADIERNLYISSVTGGEDADPSWSSQITTASFKQSLEQSLSAQRLLSTNAELALDATLIAMSEPDVAMDMEVACTVRYLLVNHTTGEVVFDERIVSPYLAGIEDALLSGERLRLASEGAVLANIERFLNELTTIDRGVKTSTAGSL